MEIEIWKDVKDYENYQVSNFGRVLNKKFNRILKNTKDKTGYLLVNLSSYGEVKSFKIHTLVWDYFGNEKRNGKILEIDHIDNDKQNNIIDNLQLLSHRENLQKRISLFRHKHKKNNKTSKYIGVSWQKNANKWKSSISINGKGKYIGLFINEEEASNAYLNELEKEKIKL
jgi:hypothetical protein